MAAWITCYLRRRPAKLSLVEIKSAMPMPDWWTLVEAIGIEDGPAAVAVPRLDRARGARPDR